MFKAKLDYFKSAEENQFVENNVNPKCNKWELIAGMCESKPPTETTNSKCDCFLAGSRFVEQSYV